MRPLNTWLPQTIGLLAAAFIAILVTAPPGHPYHWPALLARSVIVIVPTSLACAIAMFLTYAALSPALDPDPVILRTSAIAAGLAPLVILLQQRSLWATLAAAFIAWTLSPTQVTAKPQWEKFGVSFLAAVLLQLGIASALGEESRLSALAVGIATAPILWRIRQERDLRGPFGPKWTLAIAMLLAIFGLTAYLPMQFGGSAEAASGGAGSKTNPPSPGVSVGGKYRGVVLIPEQEEHTILVPPIPFMGRDPFRSHKDPIGIPFYGVYWFFQFPDKGPNEDAYRAKGTPDKVTFRSADRMPLKMEAHQNLGRLIDVSSCSRIDVAIRNDDAFTGSLALELILVNTTLDGRPSQTLGGAPVNEQKVQTLSFKIPPSPMIQQFDELTIRFPRANYRATKSAKVAIERFFLVRRDN
ncbi:MAG TPA: hypothetical protein VNU44_12515 [Bryobacteraceae bacterium]|jgi:hypothetical protein|nr:hypothetical protein [Bryobacteraceae bacterium]